MKYNVYAIYTASKYLGEVEAESKEAAEEKVWDDPEKFDTCEAKLEFEEKSYHPRKEVVAHVRQNRKI